MTHNLLSLFIILASCLVLSKAARAECIQIVQSLKSNFSSIPNIESGKFSNDLGDYNSCLFQGEKYTYLTVSLFNYVTLGTQYIGICVPKQCTQSLEDPELAVLITEKVNQAYRNKKDKQNATLIARLKVYSPVEVTPQMGTSNYICIGLILSLLAFELLSSIIVGMNKRREQPSNSKAIRILRSFSIYDNFKKIVEIKEAQNQNLLFLNGLRVVSICWIIFGHDQWFRYLNLKNWVDYLEILTAPGIATLVPAAYFAVDIFFWIGGFLLTIGLVSKMKKSKANPIVFYLVAVLHRFIRVWPTYMVAIIMYWQIAPYLLSGPIWSSFNTIASACNNGGIIWNMFFVDNFASHGPSGMNYCFGWGWYLAVDFQLFLITPLIFFVYNKNKTIGLILTFMIWLGSIVTAFTMIIVNGWRYPIPNPKFPPQPEFMDKFYYKPYIRVSAYIMGIWVGMFYLEWKHQAEKVVNFVNKIKNSIAIRTVFYIVGLGLINFTIWIVVPFQKYGNWTTLGQAFYNSLNRVGFLLGLTLLCFPAMFGCQNDPVHKILGSKIFSPVAKISFCMYLVHFIVIMMGVFSNRMDLYWQPMSSLYLIASDIFWTIILAVFLTLLIESPTLGIEKILTGEQRVSKPKSAPKMIEMIKQFQEEKDLSGEEPLMDIESHLEVVEDTQP